MRYLILVTCMLLGTALPAAAQAETGFHRADFSIGIGVGLPAYPNMIPVPGYPVYYAPAVHANLFYYQGQYWLFQAGNWYASGWGDGPWQYVPPYAVPPYLLRVPIRYYVSPPQFFFGWDRDEAPHWGDHWGHDWREDHHDWDHRDFRAEAPHPVPPRFDRFFAGGGFPRPEEHPDFEGHRDFDRAPHFAGHPGFMERGDHDDHDH